MTNALRDQEFFVGNLGEDQRLRKLTMLCQQADKLMKDGGSSSEDFHIILNDLAAYTREQFKSEELRLRQNNPAQLNRHLAEHISCESQLTDLLIAASNGIFAKDQLLRFLKEWCASHLLQPNQPTSTP